MEINIDYILKLKRRYHEGNSKDAEIIIKINKAIGSSIELRSKKDLIDQFIECLTQSNDVDESWQSFIDRKKNEELKHIIAEENLNREETLRYIENAFHDGYVQESGTVITRVLPPVSRLTPSGERTRKREAVL